MVYKGQIVIARAKNHSVFSQIKFLLKVVAVPSGCTYAESLRCPLGNSSNEFVDIVYKGQIVIASAKNHSVFSQIKFLLKVVAVLSAALVKKGAPWESLAMNLWL